MGGDWLEPTEDGRDFNYFNYLGPGRIEIIEIIEIRFPWLLKGRSPTI